MADRKKYIEKMSAKLKEWDDKVKELEVKADKAAGDMQEEYRKQAQDLRARVRELDSKLAEMRDASGDAWQELKQGLENSWGTFESSLKKAAAKFK